MEIFIYLLLLVFLLFLNGFFVLAEFATVKLRPTQIEALIDNGDKRAKAVKYIQTHLDEFLSVCQLGITLASIGLGFVGEPVIAKLVQPLVSHISGSQSSEAISHAISITIGYISVSFLHIVVGELIPKSMAIRATEKSALLISYPMLGFRYLFILPIIVLNSTVNIILKLFGFPEASNDSEHSEDEIRLILDQSQSNGVMSFKRLLLMENILDMPFLTIKNAMQPLRKVCFLNSKMSKEEINNILKKNRYSRYPLIDYDTSTPLGFVHIKDLYFALSDKKDISDLKQFIRPCLRLKDDASLEMVLSTMQKRAMHMAFVFNKKEELIGIATLEDVLEEVIGIIEEEFPLEEPVHLSDFLTPNRVLLGINADSILSAARTALKLVPQNELPLPYEELMLYISDRERLCPSYVGKGLAIPHARILTINKPVVIFVRLKNPIQIQSINSKEKLMYLFILITPANMPRIHQILLSHIAAIFESDFLENRLDDDLSAEEIYKIITTAEETMLS